MSITSQSGSVSIPETMSLLNRGFVLRRINRVWRVIAADSGAYWLIGGYRTERLAFQAAMAEVA